MTLYEGLLWIHISSAILWVGGATMILILATKLRAASEGEALSRIGGIAETLGKTFFMPLAIVQLASGIWMVLEADWGFDRFWIAGGIAGIVASTIIGAGFLGPEGGRLAIAVEERGFGSPEVQSSLDKIFLLNRIDVAILFLVVFLMAVKPGS